MLPVNSCRHITYQAFVLENVVNIILILLYRVRQPRDIIEHFTIFMYLIQMNFSAENLISLVQSL